ncbi:MAG: putative lipid II flippase FtsW [Spirochaetaceae bacterium]|nr:MAG: putative lipid II flippase FtsW [Spirochaetaceae bacterium]
MMFTAERVEKKQFDLTLLSLLLVLVGVGTTMLFSSSYFRAENLFADPLHFLRRQSVWVVLGAVAAFAAARVSLDRLQRWTPLMISLTFGLMILTFVPGIGVRFLGARRWIFVFGYSFQPSELVKLTLIVYLAHILSRKHEQIDDPVNALLPPVIMVALFVVLIYLQNDFSSAGFVIVVAMAMFFVAGVPIRYFFSLGAMVMPLSLLLLLTREHRVNRVLAFIDPARDPAGAGYQVLISRAALVHGGMWGSGIGGSVRKLGRLPEAHSDFVFAVIAEELGFIGVAAIVALFALLAYRGYRIAYRCDNRFCSLLAFGLTSSIFLQALLNMAVVSGMVPATGVPLPFFSSGGSSAFVTLIMCGLLLNISRRNGQGELHG